MNNKSEAHLALLEIANERLKHDVHYLRMLKDDGVIPEVAYSGVFLSKFLIEEALKEIKEESSN